jgi:hypothetical protein
MGHLNGTHYGAGFVQHEFQMQGLSHMKLSVNAELKSSFGEINDLAWKCLGTAPDLTRPIDRDSEEFSFLGHGWVHLLPV